MKLFFSSATMIAFLGLLGCNHNVAHATNMNPLAYKVANSDTYPADFGQAEYFEVYTPLIRTRYSEVYWKTQDPVDLPNEIIQRFENRTMAVVGFEVDQVYHEKDTNGNDVSVPITFTYNHHFNSWLVGRNASIFQKTHPNEQGEGDIPLVQTFTSGNGGEFRMSYKGYPKGYAQLIDSPNTARFTVMAIDTWNRDAMTHNAPKLVPGPLPKFSQSRFPGNGTSLGVSPLAECPCSDRVVKEGGMSYQLTDGVCKTPVTSASECRAAVSKLVQSREKPLFHIVKTPNDLSFSVPQGCSIEHQPDRTTHGYWRQEEDQSLLALESKRDLARNQLIAMATSHQVNVTVELDSMSDSARITLSGPSDRWFAVAFGTHNMCLRLRSDQCPDGGPNAIIVSGDNVTERVLDYHGPGRLIETSLVVESTTVTDGYRTVVVTRSLQGLTDDHYSFEALELATPPSDIPIIVAQGCGVAFAQHCGHGPATLNFLPIENGADRQLTTICGHGVTGTIDGADFQISRHQERCAAFPKSDLTDQHNPTCAIDTYTGGFLCCRDGHSLLDSDQEIPWADQYLEYHLKFRFYFEEYSDGSPAAAVSNDAAAVRKIDKPSHENLLNFAWMTESNAQEYDTPLCPQGTHPSQCLHVITSRFHVRDMIRDCPIRPDGSYCSGKDASQSEGIKLMYISAHCHAGSCHSMELYNVDTGRLICHVEPIVGESDTEIFQERGYIALPPCLFSGNVGNGQGLLVPETLLMNTTLLSIKRVNTTFAHTGEMAMWQMRGVLVPQGSPTDFNVTSVPTSNNSSDYVKPDSDSEADYDGDLLPYTTKASTALFVALFGAWAIFCFFVAMLVWTLAFRPRRAPDLYFHGEFTDLILTEEVSVV